MSTTNTTKTSKLVHNGNNNNKEHRHRNDVDSKMKLKKNNSTMNIQNKNIVDNISHKVLHFNVSHSPRNETNRHNNQVNNFKQKRFKLNSGLFSPSNELSTKINDVNLNSMRNLPQIATPHNNTHRMQRSASTFNMFNYIKHIPEVQSPQSNRNNNNKHHYDYNNVLSTNRQYINSNNSNNIITSRNNVKKAKITIMGLSNINVPNHFRKSSSTSTLKSHTIKL